MQYPGVDAGGAGAVAWPGSTARFHSLVARLVVQPRSAAP